MFLTPDQLQWQAAAQAARKKPTRLRYGRLRVAPELVIESISLGHELHDRQTKLQGYRDFGIPNYWLLDPVRRTLDCLRLANSEYQPDAAGKDLERVTCSMFPGLDIQLQHIWI
ncbi:MAG TPA: Uma2 family endonuclease [Tepidisphaeraceae bacterium]|nr:Uma2 family endonuclease [Tepidisphaeraceae bacterium]